MIVTFNLFNYIIIQISHHQMQQALKPKKVIIIGGGLSGLSAAQQILKQDEKTEVIVLQAMQEVGGRTCSRTFYGVRYDLGATWIGGTQKYAQKLAERAHNQLIPQYHKGAKVLHLQSKVSTYQSNIPLNVGIPALIHMQFNLWKINRMANKVDIQNPSKTLLAHHWDSQTVRSWIENNIYFIKVKLLFQCAIRAVLGCQTDEVSLLFFLWYIKQNGGIENLINIESGLQQKKMSKGAQQLSLYLRKQIQQRKGVVKTKCFVKKVEQKDSLCAVWDAQGNLYEGDYVIIAIPPVRINKIQFSPPLSRQRTYLCQRNFMGSITKILLFYQKPYWRQKGFSGQTLSDCVDTPIFNAYDESRIKSNGQIQPAIVVFLNGAVDRQWSSNREESQKNIIKTLSQYFDSKEMLNPLKTEWKVWSEQESLGGGPIAYYPPGVLSKIENIRSPQGRIHWAGTQMARQSQGFMDGAIESGLRAASQVELARLKSQIPQIMVQEHYKQLHKMDLVALIIKGALLPAQYIYVLIQLILHRPEDLGPVWSNDLLGIYDIARTLCWQPFTIELILSPTYYQKLMYRFTGWEMMIEPKAE